MVENKRILFLSPHLDDVEISCGGTIVKFIEEGAKVFVVVFSAAKADVKEYFKSMSELGVENPQLYNFQFRIFKTKRQEILDKLIKIRKEIRPDIVFLPATGDTHQDHEVISQEGFRAFKKSSILGYQQPWALREIKLQFFIPLEEKHIDKKIKALSFYKSQVSKFYTSADYIKNEAKYWGSQVELLYAEIFETIRWLL